MRPAQRQVSAAVSRVSLLHWRTARQSFFAVCIPLLLACDPRQDSPTPITIELAQDSVSIIAGLQTIGPGRQDLRTLVTLTVRRNGYSGPVSVAAQPVAPADPPSTLEVFSSIADSTGYVLITARSGTPAGTYRYRIRASAGPGSVAADLAIHVVPFKSRIHQRAITVSQGALNTVSVYLTTDGPSPMNVEVHGSAPGVTATATLMPDKAYVDFTASPTASTGSYPFTIVVESGTTRETHTVDVTVQAPPPRRAVAFRLCHNPIDGEYVGPYAYANDGEAWTFIQTQDGVLRFDATDRVRVAELFTVPGIYGAGAGTRVLHVTADELEEMQCTLTPYVSSTAYLRTSNAEKWLVSIAGARASETISFPFRGLGPGPHDLIATATRSVATGSEHRGIVRHGVELADGDTIVVDFLGAESVALDSAVLGAGSTATSRVAYMHTPRTVTRLSVGPTENRYWAFPEALLAPGEVQSLLVYGTAPGMSSYTGARGIVQYFRGVADVQLSFGPEVSTAVTDVESGMITVASQPEYPDLVGIAQLYTRDGRGIYDRTEIFISKSYMGATPAEWVFTVPDLGRVRTLSPFHSNTVTVAVRGSTALFFGAMPAPGSTLVWASNGPFKPFPYGY